MGNWQNGEITADGRVTFHDQLPAWGQAVENKLGKLEARLATAERRISEISQGAARE